MIYWKILNIEYYIWYLMFFLNNYSFRNFPQFYLSYLKSQRPNICEGNSSSSFEVVYVVPYRVKEREWVVENKLFIWFVNKIIGLGNQHYHLCYFCIHTNNQGTSELKLLFARSVFTVLKCNLQQYLWTRFYLVITSVEKLSLLSKLIYIWICQY